MKELIIERIEAKKILKDTLYGQKTALMHMIPLNLRKKLWNERIKECVDKELEGNLEFPLFRGMVIEDDGIYDEDNLLAKINEYKTGPFSCNKKIANAFSRCGNNGNLDIYSSNYYSVILRFVDGDYLSVFKLFDENDMFERHFIREKEFYCFPKEVLIEEVKYYGSSLAGKKIAESIISLSLKGMK